MKKLVLIILSFVTFSMVAQKNLVSMNVKADTSIASTIKSAGDAVSSTVANTVSSVKETLKGTDSTIMENVKQLMPDSNSLTFKKVYDDIKLAIHSLAEGLKVGTTKVFEILCLQQVVKSIVWTLLFIFGIILIFWMKGVLGKARFVNDRGDDIKLNFFGFLFIVQFITASVLFGCFFANIFEVVTGFINPEFGAIKDIFDFIQNKNIK